MCAVNALIVVTFRKNRANLRNVEIGFDSRTRCVFVDNYVACDINWSSLPRARLLRRPARGRELR
jgi:hypothetical protein